MIHDHHPVGQFQRLLLIVRHEDRGEAHLGVQLTQPTAQILPHLRIECAERFVEQQQLGIDSKRASQSDTLTLAPGKLRGIAIGDLPELRSEEHTSELQSLMRISYAVFCLKKTRNPNVTTTLKRHNKYN